MADEKNQTGSSESKDDKDTRARTTPGGSDQRSDEQGPIGEPGSGGSAGEPGGNLGHA